MSEPEKPMELGDLPAKEMTNVVLWEATVRSCYRLKRLVDEYRPPSGTPQHDRRDRIYLEMGKLLAGVLTMGERLPR